MKNSRKLFLLLLSAVLLFPVTAFCADNIGRNVYSVFTENFNGAKFDYIDSTSSDCVQVMDWGASTNRIRPSTHAYADNPLVPKNEGSVFWRLTGTMYNGAWWGGGVLFSVGTTYTARLINMSEYAGGTLEFYARSTNAAMQNLQIGISINMSGGDRLRTLSSLGFVADGQWHKIVFPFDYFSLTAAQLQNTKVLFMYSGTSSTLGTVEFDDVVWKKAASAGGTFKVNIKKIADDSADTEITWDDSVLGKRWEVAQQYLELDLDYMPDDNWAVQLYTVNTEASAFPRYTGEMLSSMGSGLVASSDTTKMLPICWRITDKVLPYSGANIIGGDDFDKTFNIGFNEGGLYDQGSVLAGDAGAATYYTWFVMKDKAMFSLGDADVQYGADYLRAWDRRGFHAAAGDVNYWGMDAGRMDGYMIKPRIYIGADFGTAITPMAYETNAIIIELFYE